VNASGGNTTILLNHVVVDSNITSASDLTVLQSHLIISKLTLIAPRT
jgi:hypothetical protein